MSAESSYSQLSKQLLQMLDKSRVITDPALCYALGTDASFYRLVPKIIVKVSRLDELVQVCRFCRQYHTPYTFRAAGTSLSGQALTDSVLIMLTDDWQQYEILDNGHRIKLQPGIIGAKANDYLKPYGRKIGPDPASINHCKIGGIAANNASGMCCGVANNSYQTLHSMRILLADGSLIDTADEQSVVQFKQTHAELLTRLSSLAEQTQQDSELKKLIEKKYRLKNTTGYSLNALIDYQDPIQIMQHLMIGSEGSLGFIAEITYQTLPLLPYHATGLFIYNSIDDACLVVEQLASKDNRNKLSAVELIDGRSLRSIKNKPGIPDFVKNCDLQHCALLIELTAETKQHLVHNIQFIKNLVNNCSPKYSIEFTTQPSVSENLWQVRKGLFPSVGAIRKTGTSVIIEDVAFPIESLAAATQDLQKLFEIFEYDEAIIFGHALDGNLHFVFTQDFSDPAEIQRYQQVMQHVTQLVSEKYQGSLKAEHGTGRNMAPFVELEWGKKATLLMQQIKQLFDPESLLNPGVIINADPQAHIKNFKQLPKADDLIDTCIECGFCESVCPSRNLSLTPRQRIALFRNLQQLKNDAQKQNQFKQSKAVFDYHGIDTCAATGLCELECPVEINTGTLIKKLRAEQINKPSLGRGLVGKKLAKWSAHHFSTASGLLKSGLKASQIFQGWLPQKLTNQVGEGLHKVSNNIPIWFAEYPTANNNQRKPLLSSEKKVVYYASCASRTMGTQPRAEDQRSLSDVTISLLEKAGYQVIIAETQSDSCCGQPFESKGFDELAEKKSNQLKTLLYEASLQGDLPILIDTSPCALRAIKEFEQSMAIYEPASFAAKYLLDALSIKPLSEPIMLHITCSVQKLKQQDALIQIANRCSEQVIIPEGIACCGFAGDKGFTTPELNAAALAGLKQQIPENCQRGFSSSLTCEIGLSRHSGIPYQNIFYLLDEVSQESVAKIHFK